ncbi:hypothetical protein [Granulicella sp. L46]|uniref:hypothetical protein n=1 Tax=Granulicella sp. L46 TaxID=1641865 RepID=UPI00131E6D61|nr:hypothetical protein [Granulicella sp. L46]
MVYLPSVIVGLSFLAVIIVILARGGSSLSSWLFAIEVIVLFECFGNCFVPGSWKQFWEIEIPAMLIAGGLAVASSILSCRRERVERGAGFAAVAATPQMLSFYGVMAIVAIIVASH